MNFFLKIFLLNMSFAVSLAAQKNIQFENKIYSSDIHSVQTLVNGVIKSIPIIALGGYDKILFQFDDLVESEEKNYYYKIIHCNRNWEPSTITEVEYIDGFNSDILRNWEFSNTTKVNFTHYWLQIPNKDINLKISGNYLLVIYDRGHSDQLILTKRFMVAESKLTPQVNIVRPIDVATLRNNHQINLKIDLGKNKFVNPQRDIYVDIIQNGVWPTEKKDIKPNYIANNVMNFDNFGGVSFKALTEYRSFELRRLRSKARHVAYINYQANPTYVELKEDTKQACSAYSFLFDFNGNYYVDNWDFTDPKIRDFLSNASFFEDSVRQTFITRNELLDNEYQVSDKDLRADYCEVKFKLNVDEALDGDVYVYGGLSNWSINPEFKLKFNAQENAYELKALLKQAYYDYYYVVVDKENKSDFSQLECSWTETENDYLTLVYLSEFTSRYDRIIGYKLTNSR